MSSDIQAGNPSDGFHGPSHDGPDHSHVVQFYESDEYLLLIVSQFVTTTIENGEAGIVVGTSDHLERLDEMLLSNGFDVSASKTSGQFVPLDTASIMPQFMVAGEPDPALFHNLFGSMISKSQASWPYVRIFGEMVALTAEIDYATATVDLEHLWNDLLKQHDFSLSCAYPISTFRDSETGELLRDICEQHSAVYPAESYFSLTSDADRFREVAVLQQKAARLEHEVQERTRAQQRLSEALDAEREASATCQAALQIRDEFVSNAAHELKTPLTSLIGRAQLALRRVKATEPVDPAMLESLMSSVVSQADKLSRLIGQLLDVSRLKGGKLPIERETVDLVKLLRESVNSVYVGENSHTISLQTPETMVAEIDPIRMEQVIINLINNAVKYSPAGTEVTITLDWPDAETIELCVQDQGPGILIADRDKVFERFYQGGYQGGGQEISPTDGMGLGLYICREIVDLHGGEILAEFPESGGTRVIVRLPLSSTPLTSTPI